MVGFGKLKSQSMLYIFLKIHFSVKDFPSSVVVRSQQGFKHYSEHRVYIQYRSIISLYKQNKTVEMNYCAHTVSAHAYTWIWVICSSEMEWNQTIWAN